MKYYVYIDKIRCAMDNKDILTDILRGVGIIIIFFYVCKLNFT